MLTKTDLKQIREVIREEIKVETEPIKNNLQQVRGIVKEEIRIELDPIKKTLKRQGSKISKIEKLVDTMARLFDLQDVRLGKRVKRIENHLGLPPFTS